MTDQPKTFPSVRDDWRVVSGGLLRGLSHDLNGRVTALSASTLALEDGDVDQALAMLREEAGRLATLGRRLEALAHTYADPEPVVLREAVEDALALARLDVDLDAIEMSAEVPDDVAPALVPRPIFLRLFLAVLTGLSRAAGRHDARGVHAEARAEGEDVLLALTVSAARGADAAAIADFQGAAVFGVLASAVGAIHGRLDALTGDTEPSVVLRVPSTSAPTRPPADI